MIGTRIRASIEAYIAAWNEHDAARRMRLIEQACAEDLRMRTPGKRIDGRAELDALIADFQQRRPGERAVLASAVDLQGHVFRYAGVVEGSPTARAGETFDAGECDENGRIRLLLSFVGAALPSRT
ncbi:MAG TPA: nuclear transport factor 2 family protein [Labilithrix sp.]|nr:nuclear transport factor 2 family protein [Labilithrix sp.]